MFYELQGFIKFPKIFNISINIQNGDSLSASYKWYKNSIYLLFLNRIFIRPSPKFQYLKFQTYYLLCEPSHPAE